MMKFFSFLALYATAVTTSPILTKTAQNQAVITSEFHLRTTNSHLPEYNQLYVMPYQTGTGSSDAVLTKDVASASSVYLNGTRALVDMGTSTPRGLILSEEINYGTANNASWDPVVINAGESQPGFGINDQDLFHWSYARNFDGWMVCQWYHNVPQLFWQSRYYFIDMPTSCSRVELKVIFKS